MKRWGPTREFHPDVAAVWAIAIAIAFAVIAWLIP